MKSNNNSRERPLRVNEQIRFSPVRVVKDSQQLGVMQVGEARRLAIEAGLDLVEVVPNARPPVCHIVDYGKYKYEKSLKEKEQKKKSKQSQIELKEVQLSPKIAENDINTKIKAVQKFLVEGKKVQLTLILKNREVLHREEGFKVINKILKVLEGTIKIEYGPKSEGRNIICRMEPKKENERNN